MNKVLTKLKSQVQQAVRRMGERLGDWKGRMQKWITEQMRRIRSGRS